MNEYVIFGARASRWRIVNWWRGHVARWRTKRYHRRMLRRLIADASDPYSETGPDSLLRLLGTSGLLKEKKQ